MKFAVIVCLLLVASSVSCQDQVSDCYSALREGVNEIYKVALKSQRAQDSDVLQYLEAISSSIFDVVKLCDKVTDSSSFKDYVTSYSTLSPKCFTYLHDIIFLAGLTKEAGDSKDWESFYELKKDFLYNVKKISGMKDCKGIDAL